MLDEGYKKMGSEPIVIAKIIEKAILSNHPQTRYVAGWVHI